MPNALGNADVELKYAVDANGVGDSMEQITADTTIPENGSGTDLTFLPTFQQEEYQTTSPQAS